jgi:hypothetical protein
MKYILNITEITGNTLNFNFPLKSKNNNLGLYSTINDTIVLTELIKTSEFYNNNWLVGNNLFDVSGMTSNKLSDIKGYNPQNPIKVGVIGDKEVLSISGNSIKYKFIADNDNQSIIYETNITDFITDFIFKSYGLTVSFNNPFGVGNSQLNGLVMEDKNIGFVEKPIIKSKINIDRGKISPQGKHLDMRRILKISDF